MIRRRALVATAVSAPLVLAGACEVVGNDDPSERQRSALEICAPRIPVATPPASAGHGLVYDATRGTVLLLTGTNGPGSGDAVLYELSPSTTGWSRVDPTGPVPSSRFAPGFAYDHSTSRSVLFGGNASTPQPRDVWEWDGCTWTDRTPASAPRTGWPAPPGAWPSSRWAPAMTYDWASERVILTTGIQNPTYQWETDPADATVFEWDSGAGTFVVRAPLGQPPTDRGGALAIGDRNRKLVYLVTGLQENDSPSSAWDTSLYVWNGATGLWSKRSASPSPPARLYAAGYHDPVADRVVVTGGVWYGWLFQPDWWNYNPATDTFAAATWTSLPQCQGNIAGCYNRFWSPLAYDEHHHVAFQFSGELADPVYYGAGPQPAPADLRMFVGDGEMVDVLLPDLPPADGGADENDGATAGGGGASGGTTGSSTTGAGGASSGPTSGVDAGGAGDISAGAGDTGTVDIVITNGHTCVSGADCASGFCADGVCCDAACGGSNPNDCQACSVTAGAAADGACVPLPASHVCRASVGPCDATETCDGADVSCPSDVVEPAGQACAQVCSTVPSACTGNAVSCPAMAGNGATAIDPVDFEVARALTSGYQSGAPVRLADMNADGYLDIVTLETRSCSGDGAFTATVRLGRADGRISDPLFVPLDPSTSDVGIDLIVSDLDGDGDLDVAGTFSTESGGKLAVLIGDGTGALTIRRIVTVEGWSRLLQLAAVSLDGNPWTDLVVAVPDVFGSELRVYHDVAAAAEPTLTAETFPNGFWIRDLAVGDLDRDGRADVAVLGYNWFAEQQTSVFARLNDGAGGLIAPPALGSAPLIDVGSFGFALALWQTDDAAPPSVVVATSQAIRSWPASGPLAYGPASVLSPIVGGAGLNDSEERLAVEDLDRDGNRDLMYGGGGDPLILLFGDGLGGISQRIKLDAGYATSFASGDLNHDGRVDLATGGYSGIGVISGRGPRQFKAPAIIDDRNSGLFAVGPIRLDGDAFPDFVVIAGGDPNGDLIPVIGVGGGAFSVGSPVPLDGRFQWIAALLGTGSGSSAVAVVRSDFQGLEEIAVFRTQFPDGSGTGLQEPSVVTPPGIEQDGFVTSVLAGSFLRESAGQLLVAYQIPDGAFGWRTRTVLYPWDGDTGVGLPITVREDDDYVHLVATVDVDGDGNLDFLSMRMSDPWTVDINLGGGDGSFVAGGSLSPGIFEPPDGVVAVGDLTGDGRADLAFTADSCPSLDGNRCVAMFVNQGSGTFAPPVLHPVAGTPFAVAIVDLDQDGAGELLFNDDFGLHVVRGATGGFGAETTFGDTYLSNIAVADVNADGKPDLVAPGDFGLEALINTSEAAPRLPRGAACAADTSCMSNHCVDGVCCENACGGGDPGDCQACSIAAGGLANGTCAPLSAARVCRASTGVCDVPETCNGTSPTCPADGFTGVGTVCRASAGACDLADLCSGVAPDCPPDLLKPASAVCRPSAGACDPSEVCSGFEAACPADARASAGTTCRASAGPCDVSDSCDGASPACPADALAPPGLVCQAAANPCQLPATCDGTSFCPAPASIPGCALSQVATPPGPDTGALQLVGTNMNQLWAVSIEFLAGIATAGVTSVAVTSTGNAPPTGYRLMGSPTPLYWDFETTATLARPDGGSPTIVICINYGTVTSGSESSLQMFHDVGAPGSPNWQQLPKVSQLAHVLCARTQSLSPFVIAQPIDSAPPVLSGVPKDMVAYATSARGAAVTYKNPTATDAVDGGVSVSCKFASGSTFPPGKTTVTCSASDRAGNTARATFSVWVQFQAPTDGSFFLKPIRSDGSSFFRIGRSVPVKFQLQGASAGITDLVARLVVTKVSDQVRGTVEDTGDEDGEDTDFLFKYRAAKGIYGYRWKTKDQTQGTYRLRADLGDDVTHMIDVSLKRAK